MKVETWIWRECRQCRAPVIQPLPEFWSYTVKKQRTGISLVRPHLPECAMGFKKVEIPDDDGQPTPGDARAAPGDEEGAEARVEVHPGSGESAV